MANYGTFGSGGGKKRGTTKKKAPRKSSKRKGDGLTVKVLRSRARTHNKQHCIRYSKLKKSALKSALGLK